MQSTVRRLFGGFVTMAVISGTMISAAEGAAAAPPSPPPPVPVPADLAAQGPDAAGSLAPALRDAKGPITVSVALSRPPVAATVPDGATSENRLPTAASQRAQTAGVEAQQNAVVAQAAALGAQEVGRATTAANVVAVTVPAKNLTELAAISGVVSVKPVGPYETQRQDTESGSLAQAADYVRATEVRAAGYDGSGVKVAVLDSGVDYTHRYLGGPGTEAAYQACYKGTDGKAYDAAPVGECAALFGPSAPKVKGGFDFVGETWPAGPEASDPNPIDLEGHGTHVSDIIGGRSADGTHQGIRPGGRSLRAEGLLGGCHLVQWCGDPRGHRLGAGPERRWCHLRRHGRREPVIRPGVRAGPGRHD